MTPVQFEELERSTALDVFLMDQNIAAGKDVDYSQSLKRVAVARYNKAKENLAIVPPSE